MIRVYATEYIKICEFLEKTEGKAIKRKKRYIVSRKILEELLRKNNYETVQTKLRIWKSLGWLDAESKHYTKKVYLGESKKYHRMYVLNADIYEVLREVTDAKTEEI